LFEQEVRMNVYIYSYCGILPDILIEPVYGNNLWHKYYITINFLIN